MDPDDLENLLAFPREPENENALNRYLNNVRNRNLYLATFAAVLGPLSFGFVLGYSSPAISDLKDVEDPRLVLDKNAASWFGQHVSDLHRSFIKLKDSD